MPEAVKQFDTKDAFAESSTGTLSGQLVQPNGSNIERSAISALVGTLVNDLGAVVNSRSAQDMLNDHDATVSESGAFALELQPADTAAREAGPEFQPRYLTLKCTHSGGKVLVKSIQFYIRKVHGHP